jgi:hypothetical protein
MTFPATPLDATYELHLDGAWTDITALVYGRDDVTISRGRSSEGNQVDRSTCSLTANNRSGDLTPRNPTGAYYGAIGRNTPLRVRVEPATDPHVQLDTNLASIRTPDSTGLSITGDLDARIDLECDDWSNITGLCGKWGAAGQRSWQFVIDTDHTLRLLWSANGTTELSADSTAAATIADGDRIALRATIDVNNGAAGRTITFYTASTIDGSWSQLGSAVVQAGTTSIFDSTADTQAGELENGAYFGPVGRVYGLEVYSGIAGTLRAAFDGFDDVAPARATMTDSLGNIWTPDDDAYLVDPRIRFCGEVSDWPVRWDISGTDVYVPLEASGILRRLDQGQSPLRSTMYRGTIGTSGLRAYWPCEDGEDATALASALDGHPPMIIPGTDDPNFAAFSDFKCSGSLPTLGDSAWVGAVPTYTNTNVIRVWFLCAIPAGGATDGEALIHIHTSGTASRWRLLYGTGGNLTLKANDGAGTEILSSGPWGFDLNGKLVRIAVQLSEDGADVDWDLATLEVGSTIGVGTSDTLASYSVNRCTTIVVNSGDTVGEEVAIGHVAVWDETASIYDLDDELNAYAGETAGRRILRLCEEEGIAARSVGDPDDSTPLGYQLPNTLLDLLREAEQGDGGILYEPRDMLGLAYRTRESMYRQTAKLTLDYAANDLSGIEPVDDDQHVRNDITVTRIGGSSARAVRETGALSTSAPPDGVGRYDEGVNLSLEADHQAADQAGWRLHLGTTDEYRYPVLSVDLARSNFTSDSALTLAAQDLDIGDRLVVENPPAWLPPDDISQLAQGFTETLANFIHRIGVNCSPETPWQQTGEYDATDVRYTSDGTVTAEALDTTETGVDVTTASGPVWSDADGDFDIVIGGERMTVTSISGSGASQTFTVTRSVNGVVKSHSSGAAVELAEPTVYVI